MAWGKLESLSWSSSIQKYGELLLQGRGVDFEKADKISTPEFMENKNFLHCFNP
jgi:hypothetical protein